MSHFNNRRRLLVTASGIALFPTVVGRAFAAGAVTPCNVTVGTWGGDYQNLLEKLVGRPIIEANGGTVTYDTASQVVRKTKMRAEKSTRRGSMDVSILGDGDMYSMQRAGVLQELDTSLIPNLDHTYEELRNEFAVPHIFSALVLVYNADKIKVKPNSFNAALDPRYIGRFGISDILSAPIISAAALAADAPVGDFVAAQKFLKELKAMRPRVYPSNEAVASGLKSGEIWLTLTWKARALQWKKAGLPLEFALPAEGVIPITFEAAVPKSARSKECGFQYLNALLNPSAQAGFALAMGYAPTIKNSGLSADVLQRVGFTDAEMSKFVQLDFDRLLDEEAMRHEYWNKDFKAGL